MKLTAEQNNAVTRINQDVCVVAGPGSGKTRVLVERFAWLVEQQGMAAESVLAFTFTEKAATEIKRRLVQRFENNPPVRAQMERAWVSTMHGFCARFLRENAISAEVDPQFTVLDELQASDELSAAIEQALNELVDRDLPAFRELLNALSAYDLPGCLANVYEAMRIGSSDAQLEPELLSFADFAAEAEEIFCDPLIGWNESQKEAMANLQPWWNAVRALRDVPLCSAHFEVLGTLKCNLAKLKNKSEVRVGLKVLRDERIPVLRSSLAFEYFKPQRQALWQLLLRVDEIYSESKRSRGALDFADLERSTIQLLAGNQQVRESTQRLFDAILMDELQDTNPLQWTLVQLLRTPGSFFAVGDINQSIYSFRHAEPQVFCGYRDELEEQGETIDRLRENHRTRGAILSAVTAVVGSTAGIEPLDFQPARQFDDKPEPSVEVIVVSGEKGEDLAAKEASWIAQRIRELEGRLIIQDSKDEEKRRPLRFSDIAVLVRKSGPMGKIEEAFRNFGIPCVVGRGSSFYEAQEVTDLVRFLRVLENPLDEISLAAVLRSPLCGVTDETLLRMKQVADLAGALAQISAMSLDPQEALKLERLRDQLQQLRPLIGYVSPDRLVARAMDDSDYEGGLDARGCSNVEKFLSLVRDLWTNEPGPLGELLDDLQARRGARSEGEAPPDDTTNAVRMMSIHAAKGLEFPVVFLDSMQSGVRQGQPDLCYSNEFGLGARWRVPGAIDSVPDAIHEENAQAASDREKKEADRLLFVAMTRAEQHLVLSFAKNKTTPCNWPKLVSDAFRFDPKDVDTQPAIITPEGCDFSIRLWRTNQIATNQFDSRITDEEDSTTLLAQPGRAGQYDSTASVTALVRFRECPRRYFLGNYLGWQTATPLRVDFEDEPEYEVHDEMDAAELGQAVHAWLAGVRDGTPDASVIELASRFEKSELGKRAARAERSGRESAFIFALDELVLRGQIDLWFEEGGELIIVDYKTDRFQEQTRAQKLETYGMQLRFYAAALSRQLGRKVNKICLYLLRDNTAEFIEVGSEDLLGTLIQDFRASQESLEFPMREGEHCRKCPFYDGLCEVGS